MQKFFNKIESKLDSMGGSHESTPSQSAQPPLDLNSAPSQRHLYQYRQQHGVNLGSWFTLETWLTGSLFRGVQGQKDSEMDLLHGLGPGKAKEVLESHWDHFVNDGDWKWLSSQGINTVRLPISYYHFLPGQQDSAVRDLMSGTEYEPFSQVYAGAWQRIEAAITKAGSAGIGVLVDLHSVPGAQNTDGHSGLSTKKAGLWDGMSASKNQKRTIAILDALAAQVARHDNVVGLELLNEPKNNGGLQGFYEDAIRSIRKHTPDLPLYLGDAWDLRHYSQWVSKQTSPTNFLVVDHHLYRCFTKDDHSTSAGEHAARIHPAHGGPTCSMLRDSAKTLGGALIIGEWSAALNPGSLQGRPQDDCQREWGHAQAAAYAAFVGGNFFWTLKKEGAPDGGWNMYSAMEKGVLPRRSSLKNPGDGQQAGQQALQGHSNYWNSHGASGDHKAFSDGFSQGWKDAQSFAQSQGQATIGFYGQWAKVRADAWKAHGGDGKAAWEFEHGCAQAIGAFNQAARG